MTQTYNNSEELEKAFLPELETMYEIETETLEADIKVNGVINPVILSRDGKLIDGYRRVIAARKVGCRKIPLIISNLDATEENRVILNLQRVKSWRDELTDLLISFMTFGNKKGQKLPNGYNRYEEISKRTNFRLKDTKSLKLVEHILKNDEDDYPFAYWLIERKSDLSSIEKVMEWRQKGEYPEIVEQVIKKEISPKSAVRMVETQIANRNLSGKVFTLPTSNSKNIVLHNGNEEEIMFMLEKEKPKMIYYEPDVCTADFDQSEGSRRDKNHLVVVYASRLSKSVRPYVANRLADDGSFFIAVREFYFDGIARQLPSEVVRQVEKETGLFYKQTIFCTSGDGFTKVNKRNNLSDTLVHILWFVKNKETRIAGNVVQVHKKVEISQNSPLIYKQCSNYINQQVVPDVIVNYREKDSNVNPASIMPIFFCTKENDLVVDLSMKGSLHTAATIMNRRFIGLSSDDKKVAAGNDEISETMESFSKSHAKQLFGKSSSVVPQMEDQEMMATETV